MVLRPRRPPRWNRPTIVALAVAAAAASCGASGNDPHPTSAQVPTTPSTARSATADASAPYAWKVDGDSRLGVGGGVSTTLAAVLAPTPVTRSSPAPLPGAAGGGAWQIAGTRTNADGTTTATAWTSPDALSWTPTALSAPGVDSAARAAAVSDGRTVVVGSQGTGDGERAAVWLSSAPGQPFQQITGTDGAFAAPATATGPSGGAEMDVVATGSLGVFAAGTVAGQQAMWYSTDGRHWTRLKGAEQAINASPAARVNALLVAGNGVYAAGSVPATSDANNSSSSKATNSSGGANDASVWASTDGITWKQVAAPTAFAGDGDHTITSLVSLGSGFVAAGGARRGQSWSPASWISPDGRSWSQASETFPMPTGPRPDTEGTVVHGLATTTDDPATATTAAADLAAVGGSPSAQRLWTSRDGTSWTSVALPANAAGASDWRAGRVATDATTTVVVDDSPGSPRVLVDQPKGWTEASATPAPFGAPRATATPVRLLTSGSTTVLVAQVTTPGQILGTETTSAAVFTSVDGNTWTPSDTAPFAGHGVGDATALAGGLVAVGDTSALTSTLPAGPTGASAWFSTDARSWSLSPEVPAVFDGAPAGAARADAVTRLGQMAVAVGRAASAPTGPADQAVAWTSADGRTWAPPVALDSAPALAVEDPRGVCAGPQSVVAVGAEVTSGPGRQAAAWSSTDGQRWQSATVTPTPAPGAHESMESCLTTGNGFIAFGASQGPDGTTDAAIWYSNNGTQWTRQSVSAFAGAGLGPVKDLAVGGTTWLAVSGNGTGSTRPGGNLGLWRTTNAGSSWQRLDTSGEPWTAQHDASVDRVVLDGSTAVVAGTVDGRLTVWLGTRPY